MEVSLKNNVDHDHWQILAEHDGTAFGNRYVYGNYIDEALVMNDGTEDYYYLHDHLYSPAALLDDTGADVERYEYDAYGSVRILNSEFSILNSSQYGNPHAFTGRQLDILDNGTLHHMHYRHRDYSPQLGRFMQHDPLEYINSLNLYEYVVSNPLSYLDPWGLACDKCTRFIQVRCDILDKNVKSNLPSSIITGSNLMTLLDYMGGAVQLANKVRRIAIGLLPSLRYIIDMKVEASYREECYETVVPCGTDGKWNYEKATRKRTLNKTHSSGWMDNGMDGLVWPDPDRVMEVIDDFRQRVTNFFPKREDEVTVKSSIETIPDCCK